MQPLFCGGMWDGHKTATSSTARAMRAAEELREGDGGAEQPAGDEEEALRLDDEVAQLELVGLVRGEGGRGVRGVWRERGARAGRE